MADPRQNQPTDAELAVLEHLWAQGPSSVREIADALYESAGNSEQATVQKLCDRLRTKACVDVDSSVRPRQYRAVVERSVLIRGQLEGVADRYCSGSLAPLLSHLLADAGGLSRKDIDALRDQIEELDQKRRRPRKR